MPHQCTNCGHAFPDGSKEMLSGCPDCGGNKFQFKPAGKDDSQSTAEQPTAASSSTTPPTTDSPSTTQSPPETEGVTVEPDQPTDSSTEAPAQSTARSDVVTDEELTAAGSMGPQSDSAQPAADQSTQTDTAESSAETDEEGSNLDQLRKELNNQFESIRIVSPGQYELNLMELYDRDEYIISLREDGRYVIEVPDGWGDS